ncbi:MAG: hypothetical protein Q4C55_04535 [Eubacterium sp.]|nr:hypothetical protein [Eubacterium sp.]
MKKFMTKLTLYVFSAGMVGSILFGVITAIVFLVAGLLGGQTAEHIVRVVVDDVFPVAFALNVVFCAFGIVHNYLIGDKSFRFDIGKK